MPFFSSQRERRLWWWTLVVVAAIYSTLGLAQRLAETLGDHPIFGAGFFLLACFLVLATVITQGLKIRPSRLEISIALGILAAYLLVFVRMAIPTERSHLIEYGVVAIFIYEALNERVRQGRQVPRPALLAIILASIIGIIDEGIQMILPQRVFDPTDMLFNVLAAVMAVSASVALAWAQRKSKKAPQE